MEIPIMTVTIPACDQHEGFYTWDIKLYWICPVCGGERGEVFDIFSYDGSRRLACNGWKNSCHHVDKYEQVRKEARTNGLNDIIKWRL